VSHPLGVLPRTLQQALEDALNTQLVSATLLSGGMVNQAARVEAQDGPIFVKWHEDAPSGLFAAEANGLCALGVTNTIRVPQVLTFRDAAPAALAYLALEYIEERRPADQAVFTSNFAEALAALHRSTFSPDGFGLPEDNYLGTLRQINTPHAHWPTFYRDCRLLPQIEIAQQRKLLPPDRERLLMQVIDNLETLLSDLEAKPCLLHGDLWSGNFLTVGNEAAVIDPAVYYGEREIEMAFVELFGGFPPGFIETYSAAYPLDAGYVQRRPLHQLYYLLVHLNYFGETYGPNVERSCQLTLQIL